MYGDQSLSMRLWSTEMVATERGLEMVLRMLSLVSVYVVFCCHGQCLLRKLINFGAGQINKLWQK